MVYINKANNVMTSKKKFCSADVYEIPCLHAPCRVPEYMWERSADVDRFSVMTVKSLEKPAASGFSCRRKVLKDKAQTNNHVGAIQSKSVPGFYA